MLMRDPYEGHRSTISGDPDGNATEWTSWDFAVASAMQAIEDGTTEQGHLIWELEADDVDVKATRKIDKAKAAVDRITNADKYKSQDGEYWITELTHPYLGEGDEAKWQTREEWIKKMTDGLQRD